jgi:hypothetical protein
MRLSAGEDEIRAVETHSPFKSEAAEKDFQAALGAVAARFGREL